MVFKKKNRHSVLQYNNCKELFPDGKINEYKNKINEYNDRSR
jgi:hypothetical protein